MSTAEPRKRASSVSCSSGSALAALALILSKTFAERLGLRGQWTVGARTRTLNSRRRGALRRGQASAHHSTLTASIFLHSSRLRARKACAVG